MSQFTIGNMLSQVAGAAKSGSALLESAATPQKTDLEAAHPSTPSEKTAEVRQLGGGGSQGNRKNPAAALLSRNANPELQFFFEDEVFRIDRKGRVRFGFVTGTAESYSSDDDEEEDNEVLSNGEVRVAFYPDGKEIVLPEKSVSSLRLCNTSNCICISLSVCVHK